MKAKDIFQYCLAAFIVLGWFYLFNRVLINPIPTGNDKVADIMFGSLTTVVIMVASFFFGSNKESATKTEMLYKSKPVDESSEDPK
jgi:hypothetical protein